MMKHTTIETIKKGNMQFNSKEAKEFRAKMSKWHDADITISDELLHKNDRVRAVRTIIASNDRLIEKIKNGQNVIGGKTVESIQKENIEEQAKIDKANKDMTELREVQTKRYADAHALLNKDLWNAYTAFINDKSKRNDYIVALANFFEANGVIPTIDGSDKGVDLNDFVNAIGKKKNGARQKCRTGKHNGSCGYNAWRDVFLGEIADVLIEAKAIEPKKFTYVLKEERQGKNK